MKRLLRSWPYRGLLDISFATRLGMLTLALALLVGVGSGLASYRITQGHLEQSLVDQVESRSRIIATRLGDELASIAASLSANANNTLFANALADSSGRDNALRPFLQSFGGVGDIPIRVVVADFAGKLLVDNPQPSFKVLPSEQLRQVVDRGQPAVTVERFAGDVLVTLSVPILYANTGLPEGSLTYQFFLGSLIEAVYQENNLSQFYLNIMGPELEGVLGSRPGGGGWLEGEALVRLPSLLTPWQLRVLAWNSTDELDAELAQVALWYAVVGLLGLALIAPTGFWLARRMLRRLAHLEVAALEITRLGSLRPIQAVAIQGSDEIASLGQAFNHMLEELRVAQQQLQNQARREIEHQAERYQRLLATTLEGVVRIDLAQRRVEEVNDTFCQMVGCERATLEGQSIPSMLESLVTPFLTSGSAMNSGRGELSIEHLNHSVRTLLYHITVDVDEQGYRQLLIFFADITDRKNTEDQIQRVNRQLYASLTTLQRRDRELTLINEMNDLLLACQSREELFQVVHRSGQGLFPGGWGALAVVDDNGGWMQTVVTWGDAPVLNNCSMEDCWALRQGRLHSMEDPSVDLCCAHLISKPERGFACLPLTVQGSTIGLVTVQKLSDDYPVESWRQLIQSFGHTIKLALSNLELRSALQRQVIHDPLTGLYNRRHLDEVFPQELNRCRQRGDSLAVALVDADHFKRINDSYGHDVGDRVLRALADSLGNGIRQNDLLFRLGGEEFLLLMPGVNMATARTRMEALRQRVADHSIQLPDNQTVKITISVGIAISQLSLDQDEQSLVRAADRAVYRAKHGGRNRVMVDNEAEAAPAVNDG